MTKYQFTPQATDDLFSIWQYIATDNLEAADQVEAAVYSACEFLATTPLAGTIREDLTPHPVRFWLVLPYRTYWVVYDPEHSPLRVIRILHAARAVKRILG